MGFPLWTCFSIFMAMLCMYFHLSYSDALTNNLCRFPMPVGIPQLIWRHCLYRHSKHLTEVISPPATLIGCLSAGVVCSNAQAIHHGLSSRPLKRPYAETEHRTAQGRDSLTQNPPHSAQVTAGRVTKDLHTSWCYRKAGATNATDKKNDPSDKGDKEQDRRSKHR